MAIVNCPACSKKLKVADSSIGKKVKCSCGTVFVAEAAEAPADPSGASSTVEKILVACTECAAKLKVAATSLGKKMKCPKCAAIFVAALPGECEEEPLSYAAAEAKEDGRPQPAGRPVYPSRLFVNVIVLFLVLAYGAFFAVTYPDTSFNYLDLGLVKAKPVLPAPIPKGNQAEGKKGGSVPPPFKGKKEE